MGRGYGSRTLSIPAIRSFISSVTMSRWDTYLYPVRYLSLNAKIGHRMPRRGQNSSPALTALVLRKPLRAMPSGLKISTSPDVSWFLPWEKWSSIYAENAACANFGYWTDNSTTACFDTHNASSPIFTDQSVNNTVDRQWQWFLCNEPLFYWQEYVTS